MAGTETCHSTWMTLCDHPFSCDWRNYGFLTGFNFRHSIFPFHQITNSFFNLNYSLYLIAIKLNRDRNLPMPTIQPFRLLDFPLIFNAASGKEPGKFVALIKSNYYQKYNNHQKKVHSAPSITLWIWGEFFSLARSGFNFSTSIRTQWSIHL